MLKGLFYLNQEVSTQVRGKKVELEPFKPWLMQHCPLHFTPRPRLANAMSR